MRSTRDANPDKKQKHLDKAIEKLLKDYPPTEEAVANGQFRWTWISVRQVAAFQLAEFVTHGNSSAIFEIL